MRQAAAAREGVDLVFTYVYAHPDDEPDAKGLVEPVIAQGGSVLYVQLTCARETLLKRVDADSRRAFGKLTDAQALEGLLDRYDLSTPLPFAESLRIDTTNRSPADAAAQIVAHFGLPAR